MFLCSIRILFMTSTHIHYVSTTGADTAFLSGIAHFPFKESIFASRYRLLMHYLSSSSVLSWNSKTHYHNACFFLKKNLVVCLYVVYCTGTWLTQLCTFKFSFLVYRKKWQLIDFFKINFYSIICCYLDRKNIAD